LLLGKNKKVTLNQGGSAIKKRVAPTRLPEKDGPKWKDGGKTDCKKRGFRKGRK